MSNNRITTHQFSLNLCKKLRVTFEFMFDTTKPLLQHYCLGKSEEDNIKSIVTIEGDKKVIRRRYIEIMRKRDEFSEMDRTMFAIAVACLSWFPEKSEMILAYIERMVPGGKDLVYILTNAFLVEDGMTDSSIQEHLHMTNGTYDRRKKDAIVIYGGLILDYAIKREKEDIEKGLIDPPDFEL